MILDPPTAPNHACKPVNTVYCYGGKLKCTYLTLFLFN